MKKIEEKNIKHTSMNWQILFSNNQRLKLIFEIILINMSITSSFIVTCMLIYAVRSYSSWAAGSVKYPIIWGTDFDDIWYNNLCIILMVKYIQIG